MKTIKDLLLPLLVGLVLVFPKGDLLAQQSISENFVSNGLGRFYIGSIPDNPQNPLRLVILFHGTTENAGEMTQRGYDTLIGNNSMVVYPSAINRMQGFNGTDTVDDFQMVQDLINDVQSKYNIDTTDICIGGFSSGASFCYNLICDYNSPNSARPYKFRAMASVAGMVTPNVLNSNLCPLSNEVPLIAFHGTDDQIANYYGGDSLQGGNLSANIDSAIFYWATQNNGCTGATSVTSLPDLVSETNPSTVQFIEYSCGADARTHLYRIVDGFHSWPSGNAQIDFFGFRNLDINASQLIADFFNHSGSLSITQEELKPSEVTIYPNPTRELLSIASIYPIQKIEVYHPSGMKVVSATNSCETIDLQNLPAGFYLVNVHTEQEVKQEKVLKL